MYQSHLGKYTSPPLSNLGDDKIPCQNATGRNPQGSATETETEPPTSLAETATETDAFMADDLDPVGKLCLWRCLKYTGEIGVCYTKATYPIGSMGLVYLPTWMVDFVW